MSLDAIKQKMSALRVDQETIQAKFDEAQGKVKTLEQENLAKEQEITSLSHKNQLLEAEVEKWEAKHKDLIDKSGKDGEHASQNEALQRKLQLLEEEAEESDKNLRETNEKLRQTDVKAGHYERKVQALESSRDQWEEKYEEMAKKYQTVKTELENIQIEIGNF